MPPTTSEQSNPKPGIKPKKPRKVGKKIDPSVDDSFTQRNLSLVSGSRKSPQPINNPAELAKSPAALGSAPRPEELPAKKPNSLAHVNQSILALTSSNLAASPSSAQPAAATSIQPVLKKRKRIVTPSVISAPTHLDASPSKYYSQPTPHTAARNTENEINQATIAPSTPAPVVSLDGFPPAKKSKIMPRSKLAQSSTSSSPKAPQKSTNNPNGEAVNSARVPSPHPKKKKLKSLLGNSLFDPHSSTKSAQATIPGQVSMPPGSITSGATSGTSTTSTPAQPTHRERCKSITGLPLSTKPAPSMFDLSSNPNTLSLSEPTEQPSKTSASSSLPNPPTTAVDWSQLTPAEILARYSGLGATKATAKANQKATKPAGEAAQPKKPTVVPKDPTSTAASSSAPLLSGSDQMVLHSPKKPKELKSAMKQAKPQAAESLLSAPESTAQTTNPASPPVIPTSKSTISSSTPRIPEAPPQSKANKTSRKAAPFMSDMSHSIESTQSADRQTLPPTQSEQSAPSLSAQQTSEATQKVKGVKNPIKSARTVDEALSTCQGTKNANEPALSPPQTEPSAPFSSIQAIVRFPKKVKAAKKPKKGTSLIVEDALRTGEIDHADGTSASNPIEQSGPSSVAQETGEVFKQAKEVKTLPKRTQSQFEANVLPMTGMVDQETHQEPKTVSLEQKAPSSMPVSSSQHSASQETPSATKHALPDSTLSAPAFSTILTAQELKSRRKSPMRARMPSRIISETFTTQEYTLPPDQAVEPARHDETATLTTASATAFQRPTESSPIDSLENLASSTLPPIMSQVLMEKDAKKNRLLAVKPGARPEIGNSSPTPSHAMAPQQTVDHTAPDPPVVKDPNNLTLVEPTPQIQQVPAEKPPKKKDFATVKSGASKEAVNLVPSLGLEPPSSSYSSGERALDDPSQSGNGQVLTVVSKFKPHSKPYRISKQSVETQIVHASIAQAETSARDESETDLLATSSEPSSSNQQRHLTFLTPAKKKLLIAAEQVGQESTQSHLNQHAAKVVADTSTLSLASQALPSRDVVSSGGGVNDERSVSVSDPKTATASSKAKKKSGALASSGSPEAGQQGAGVSRNQQGLKLPSAVLQPCEAPKSGDERDGERLVEGSNEVSGIAGSQQVAPGKRPKKQNLQNLSLSHGNVKEHGNGGIQRPEEVGGLGVVNAPQRGQVQVLQEPASTPVPHLLAKIAPASAPVLDPAAPSRLAPQVGQRATGGSQQTTVGESSIPIIKTKKKKHQASAKMNRQNPAGSMMSTAGLHTGSQSADKVAEPIHTQPSKKRKQQNVATVLPNSTHIDDKDTAVEPAFKKVRTAVQAAGLPMDNPDDADGSVHSIKRTRNRRKKNGEVAVAPQVQLERNQSPHDVPPALPNTSSIRSLLTADGVVAALTPPQLKDKDQAAQQSAQVATKTGPVKFGRWELSILPDANLPENVFASLQALLDEALRAGVAKPITGPSDIVSGTGSQVMADTHGNHMSQAISQPAVSSPQPAFHNQSVGDFVRSAPQPAVDSCSPASRLLVDSSEHAPQPVTEPTLPKQTIPQSINLASQTKPMEKQRSSESDESLEAQIRRLSGPLLKMPTNILHCIVSSEDESDNQRSEYVADDSSSEPGLSRLTMLQQRYRRQSSSPEELSDESESEDGPAVIAQNCMAARPVMQPPVVSGSSHGLGDDSEPEDGPAVSAKISGACRAIGQPSTGKSSSKEPSGQSEAEDRPPVVVNARVAIRCAKRRSSVTSTSSEESKNGLAGPAEKLMAVRTTEQRSSASCPMERSASRWPTNSPAGTAQAAVAARPAEQPSIRNSNLEAEEPSDESECDEGPVVSMKAPVASQNIKRPSLTSSSSEDCSDESELDDAPSVSIKAPMPSQSIKRLSITRSSSEDSSNESEPENVPAVAAQLAQQLSSNSSSSEEPSDESGPEDGPAGSDKICVAGGLTKQSSIRVPEAENNREESGESSLSVNVSHIALARAKTTGSPGLDSAVRNAPDPLGTALSSTPLSQDASQSRKSKNARKIIPATDKDASPDKGLGSQPIQPDTQEASTTDQAKQTSLSELSVTSDDVQDVVMMALNLEQTEGYGLHSHTPKSGRGHLAKSCDKTNIKSNGARKAAVSSPLVGQSVVFTSDTDATSAASLLEQSKAQGPTVSGTRPGGVFSNAKDSTKYDGNTKILSQPGMSTISESFLVPPAISDSAPPIGNTVGGTTDTAAPKERAEESPTITSGQGVDDSNSESESSHFSPVGEAATLSHGSATEPLSAFQAQPALDSSTDDETSSEAIEETHDDERPPTPGQRLRKAGRKEKVAEEPNLDFDIASGPHLASSQPLPASQRTAADLHARSIATRRKTLDHFRPVDFSLASPQSLNGPGNFGSQHRNLVGGHESNSDSSSSDEESSDGSSTKQAPSGGLPQSKLAGADPGRLGKQHPRHNRRKSAAEMWAKEEAKIMNAKKLSGSRLLKK